MTMESLKNIVLFPTEAGDQSDRVSDNVKLARDMDFAFEPAGTIEVEKDVLVDDISDASASTSDATVDDISETNDGLFNTKPARKRRKTTSRNNRKGRIHLNGLKEKAYVLAFYFWF